MEEFRHPRRRLDRFARRSDSAGVHRRGCLAGLPALAKIPRQRVRSPVYHQKARVNAEYPPCRCCPPHAMPPAPTMISIGLAALLELLLAMTIPVTNVRAPTPVASEP